ncbi:hypothetical protein QTI66_04410 [Variovorax sp. J22R133]|uniref:hypothetical protein n=1 Tax=Variovorax brevis TaxID=3053503 RepID=UPI0025776A0E|nr:hypothetical protein [Variovorax sp. J22R133]MDM0111378.1 hypothetical protein [Variovorax sp. J22R133]
MRMSDRVWCAVQEKGALALPDTNADALPTQCISICRCANRLVSGRLCSSLLEKESRMPMELLRAVADRELPHTIYEPSAVDKLRVLRAAGLITAILPPVGKRPSVPSSRRPALVLSITSKGWRALRETVDFSFWAETGAAAMSPQLSGAIAAPGATQSR